MYSARVIRKIETKPGCWAYNEIGIFDGEKQIGSYQRNYDSLFDTFHAFRRKEKSGEFKWYALYSPKYTATRLMSLPDCKDLGGEEPAGNGFCPTGYFVPQNIGDGDAEGADVWDEGSWGFVKGCVWGDDSSMKLEYIVVDPDNAEGRVVRREARFGYCELAEGVSLKDAIKIDDYRTLSRTPGEFYDPGSANDYVHFRIASMQNFNMMHDDRVETWGKKCKCPDGHFNTWPKEPK